LTGFRLFSGKKGMNIPFPDQMSPRRTFVEQGISNTSSDAPKISIYTYFEDAGVQFAYLCCNFHPRNSDGIMLNRISDLISPVGFYRS